MITPEKLVPRFYLTTPDTIEVKYVVNDLGYLSEYEETLSVKRIYNPMLNSSNYFLTNFSTKNKIQCMVTLFNSHNGLEDLIEHFNEKPYEAILKLKAYGVIE